MAEHAALRSSLLLVLDELDLSLPASDDISASSGMHDEPPSLLLSISRGRPSLLSSRACSRVITRHSPRSSSSHTTVRSSILADIQPFLARGYSVAMGALLASIQGHNLNLTCLHCARSTVLQLASSDLNCISACTSMLSVTTVDDLTLLLPIPPLVHTLHGSSRALAALPSLARKYRVGATSTAVLDWAGGACMLVAGSRSHPSLTSTLLSPDAGDSMALTDVAVRVASQVKSYIPASLRSLGRSLLRRGSSPPPSPADPLLQLRLRGPSNAWPHATWHDEGRAIQSIVPHPHLPLALIADGTGRVYLNSIHEGLMLRVWKGYRDATLAWSSTATGATLAVLYSPRRGTLEVWPAGPGPRLARLQLPRASRVLYAPPLPATVCTQEEDVWEPLPVRVMPPAVFILMPREGGEGDGGGDVPTSSGGSVEEGDESDGGEEVEGKEEVDKPATPPRRMWQLFRLRLE